MSPAHIGAVVRLREDLPALELSRGEQGIVVSVWLSPEEFLCEVKFSDADHRRSVRTLLRSGQLEVVD